MNIKLKCTDTERARSSTLMAAERTRVYIALERPVIHLVYYRARQLVHLFPSSSSCSTRAGKIWLPVDQYLLLSHRIQIDLPRIQLKCCLEPSLAICRTVMFPEEFGIRWTRNISTGSSHHTPGLGYPLAVERGRRHVKVAASLFYTRVEV
jgi:hypothetical protein